MKQLSILAPLFISLFLVCCESNTTVTSNGNKPLQAPYEYFDKLSSEEFHFVELDHELNTARGANNEEEVKALIKEFEETQASCVKKMEEKFPEGSVKIPFEQIGGKDTLTIKSAYVSGYCFPWNTATSICFYFTVDYDIHKKDILYIPIALKFLDVEDDVINMLHVRANSNGKSRFIVRTQFTFRDLKKIIVNP